MDIVSFEYINTITDVDEIADLRKIIRQEKGTLTSIENQLKRQEQKLRSNPNDEKK